MPDLNKTKETHYDFHFPKAGIHKALAFGRQPVFQIRGQYCRTTPVGVNVRGFDPATNRDRGGSRHGLTKLVSTTVNGAWVIQELNTLVTNQQLGSGTVQTSQSGRVVILFAVSNGVAKVLNPGDTSWTAVTNNTGETPALNISGPMQSAQNNQKLYIVDGTNYVYYAPTTNSLEAWVATAGTLPEDSAGNRARLICTWRGRTVLSGLLLDPQNWFMSAVSDPNDFNYLPPSPVPATSAVAGNNADLGLIGDVVTALIPWTDDVLIFGCDHSIQKMQGDPYDGGRIDSISDSIGMAYGQAWCSDPYGNIYFISNRCGIYVIEAPDSKPKRLSQAIEALVQQINTGENIIRMIWNDRWQGLHIFVTNAAAPHADTHYFWEMRTNAWWQDTFGNNDLNPLCTCTFDGNLPDDRKLLIGCWDGYVRVLDPDATDDDGTNISSTVVIGPILTAESDMMRLDELQTVLAELSGDVTYTVHVGDTPELALSASASVTGTWSAGRNHTSPVRRADHAIYIKITSTNQWAMEWIRAKFGPMGKVRRRG